MSENIPTEKPKVGLGDSFLLFYHLPYDFAVDLPLSILRNVYVQKTPQELLDRACVQLTNYVLPGYGLPGVGVNHACLWSSCSATEKFEARDLFFLSLTALRLTAPLGIEVAGQFEVGDDQSIIKNPVLYHLVSPWQPVADARYAAEDIRAAANTAERVLALTQSADARVNSALVLFSQISCGHSKSLQMAYLALFACLEALFVPKNNKAKTLAARTAKFLTNFDFPTTLYGWLREEYEIGRNNLAHGIQNVVPWTRLRESRRIAFGRLHEIVRLCLLGFLSLGDELVCIHTQATGKALQNFLDRLDPATGELLHGQRMWCD